jgi:hypothetical protein
MRMISYKMTVVKHELRRTTEYSFNCDFVNRNSVAIKEAIIKQ